MMAKAEGVYTLWIERVTDVDYGSLKSGEIVEGMLWWAKRKVNGFRNGK